MKEITAVFAQIEMNHFRWRHLPTSIWLLCKKPGPNFLGVNREPCLSSTLVCVLRCNHRKILQGLFYKVSCIRVEAFFFISSVAALSVCVSHTFPICSSLFWSGFSPLLTPLYPQWRSPCLSTSILRRKRKTYWNCGRTWTLSIRPSSSRKENHGEFLDQSYETIEETVGDSRLRCRLEV